MSLRRRGKPPRYISQSPIAVCRKPSFLVIGLIAKLLVFAMGMTIRPSPQVLDPFQRQVFMIMP